MKMSKDGKVIVAGRGASGRTVLEQEGSSLTIIPRWRWRLETGSQILESEEESEQAPRPSFRW